MIKKVQSSELRVRRVKEFKSSRVFPTLKLANSKILQLIFWFLIVSLSSQLLTLNSLYALFNNAQLIAARPLALGGAYVAVSDDANAVNINPAGLTQLTASELALSYSNLYSVSSLSEGLVAFGIPWGFNSFGISYQRLSLTDIFKEETFTFSYARALRRTISLGLNLKLLRASAGNFSAADVSSLGSATEWSSDISLWTRPWEPFSLGLAVYDLNSPRLRLLSDSVGEKIRPTVRGGFSYHPKPFILLSGDLHTENGAFKNLGGNYHFGAELLFAKAIALRLGVDRNKFTGGVGFQQRWLKVDFAFFNQGDLGLLYRVSTSFLWGK